MLNATCDLPYSVQPEIERVDGEPPFDGAGAAREILRNLGLSYSRVSHSGPGETAALEYWGDSLGVEGLLVLYNYCPDRGVRIVARGVDVHTWCEPDKLVAFDATVRALLGMKPC